MIAFITFNSGWVPLIEGVCSSNPWEFEVSGLDGIEPTAGRAASGGALAPEPTRATRFQPEPIQIVEKTIFFPMFSGWAHNPIFYQKKLGWTRCT